VVHEVGNAGTPYCAIPWTRARQQQCDIVKGNPCHLATGTKTQAESVMQPLYIENETRTSVFMRHDYQSTVVHQMNATVL
jgi:hypothetical protein